MDVGLHRLHRREKDHRPGIERNGRRSFAGVSADQPVMEEAANALASHAIASGDLRPDVDPMDMLRAIYGVSSAGSTDDWPAKARRFVDILLQGSRP